MSNQPKMLMYYQSYIRRRYLRGSFIADQVKLDHPYKSNKKWLGLLVMFLAVFYSTSIKPQCKTFFGELYQAPAIEYLLNIGSQELLIKRTQRFFHFFWVKFRIPFQSILFTNLLENVFSGTLLQLHPFHDLMQENPY